MKTKRVIVLDDHESRTALHALEHYWAKLYNKHTSIDGEVLGGEEDMAAIIRLKTKLTLAKEDAIVFKDIAKELPRDFDMEF